MDIDIIFRFVMLAVLVITFWISASYRKKARDEGGVIERKEEGWPDLVLRMIFALPFLAVLLLNIFYPRFLVWSKIDLPLYLRIIGSVIAVFCVPLIWWVFHSIGNFISETILTKDNHQLVTSGPYRRVRHPLYASTLLLLFSISLVFEDWIIFGYTLAGVIAFRLLVSPVEEERLLDSFGEDYECYQSRTGALLPWIR